MKMIPLLDAKSASTQHLFKGDTIYNFGKSSNVSVHLLVPNNGRRLMANVGLSNTYVVPHEGTYLLTNCDCHSANIFIFPENSPYHADKKPSDVGERIVTINALHATWSPVFEDFDNLLVMIPACCEISMKHSATSNFIRLPFSHSETTYSVSFQGKINSLVFMANENCLKQLHVIVTRG